MESVSKSSPGITKPVILVVEDDRQMAGLYRTLFETREYPYILARNGQEALMEFLSGKADIVLLDLGLPDLDGQKIIEKIRSFSSAPILVVSARGEDSQKVAALDAGADDYLSKPFSVDELLARIRVIERRLKTPSFSAADSSFVNGPLKILYDEQIVLLEDEPLHLTPIEDRKSVV